MKTLNIKALFAYMWKLDEILLNVGGYMKASKDI